MFLNPRGMESSHVKQHGNWNTKESYEMKLSTPFQATFKGSSILGGVLTVVGGGLTIASAGGAAPVLLTGLGLGLASGFGGGGATITRKIIKSRQMKAAKQAVLEDSLATAQLEAKVGKCCQVECTSLIMGPDMSIEIKW